MIRKKWTLGRLEFGWHIYSESESMARRRGRLVVQPFLFWWSR